MKLIDNVFSFCNGEVKGKKKKKDIWMNKELKEACSIQ